MSHFDSLLALAPFDAFRRDEGSGNAMNFIFKVFACVYEQNCESKTV